MKTIREEDLIAYHLGELSRWQRLQMRRRLERDPELAAESEEIAATLRAFCCDPVPVVSEATMDRSWQRVRGSLGVLDTLRRRSGARLDVGDGFGECGCDLRSAGGRGHRSVVAELGLSAACEECVERSAVARKHGVRSCWRNWTITKKSAEPYNHRPGPADGGACPSMRLRRIPRWRRISMCTAERVLTEVSHTEGPLQPETREQVHRLLLEKKRGVSPERGATRRYGDRGGDRRPRTRTGFRWMPNREPRIRKSTRAIRMRFGCR